MRITSIEKYKGRRYKIEVDGEYWHIIDVEIIHKFKLREGTECCEEDLEEIRNAADYRRVRERALYLLEYRDHSRRELTEKLYKTADNPEIVETVADKMEEFGFLDDERYAQKLTRQLLEIKKYGKRRAELYMRQKGISRELASLVLEEYETDPLEQITELIDKKYARYLGDEKGRRKAINALLRLGHTYDDIKIALRNYELEIEEY